MDCFLKLLNGFKFAFVWVIDVFKILDQKDEELEFYKNKFAGSQADRVVRAEAEAENVAEQLKKTKVSGVLLHPFLTRMLNIGYTL